MKVLKGRGLLHCAIHTWTSIECLILFTGVSVERSKRSGNIMLKLIEPRVVDVSTKRGTWRTCPSISLKQANAKEYQLVLPLNLKKVMCRGTRV